MADKKHLSNPGCCIIEAYVNLWKAQQKAWLVTIERLPDPLKYKRHKSSDMMFSSLPTVYEEIPQ